MPDWTTYKGLEVPDATPTGAAGLRLKDDLKYLADRAPRRSSSNPGVNDDTNAGFFAGSLWFNDSDSSQIMFVCTSASAGAAVWKSFYKRDGNGILLSPSSDGPVQLGDQLSAQAHTVHFTQQSISISAGAATIDWRNSNKAAITLTANVTLTFTAPGGACNLVLKVTQDGTGGRTITWPGSVKWAGGAAPSISSGANKIDIVSFYYDGTNYFGVASQNFS